MPNQFTQNASKAVANVGETQKAFIARGLASLAAAKISGEYFSSAAVLKELDEMLSNAKKKTQK